MDDRLKDLDLLLAVERALGDAVGQLLGADRRDARA